jgi:hypothetical protein
MGERQARDTGMHKVIDAPEGIITVSATTGGERAAANIGVGEATAMDGGREGGADAGAVGTFCCEAIAS